MRRRLIALPVLFALLVSGASRAAAGDAGTAAARLLTGSAPPGGRALVKVTLTPERGAKLYRNKVKLELAGATPARLGKFSLPAGERKFDKLEKKELAFYTKPTSFEVPVLVPGDYSGDKLDFALRVHFMGCTDRICFPPESQKFDFTVQVSGKAAAPAPSAETSPPATTSTSEAVAGKSGVSGWAQGALEGGGLLGILAAFLLGLLVSFTPCVYPMVPVTAGLIRSAGGGKARSAVYTFVYVLGLATTYGVLGTIAGLTGGSFGGLAGNPILLSVIGGLFVLLGMSMFGAFDLTLPAGLSSRLQGLGGAGSFGGVLAMGAVTGLVASPCVSAPLIFVLAAVGTVGSALWGFFAVFAFAWGMSALLIITGIFSGHLPRAGKWMVWVKSVFGALFVAAALFFLRPLVPVALFNVAAVLLAAAAGAVLVWVVTRRLAETGKARGWTAAGGGVLLVAAAYLALGTLRAHNVKVPGGHFFLPEKLYASLPWEEYSAERLKAALEARRPVMVYFHTDGCVYCAQLKAETFPAPKVVEEAKRFALLELNDARGKPGFEKFEREHEVRGFPTLVFYGSDGKVLERSEGFVEAGALLEKMRRVR